MQDNSNDIEFIKKMLEETREIGKEFKRICDGACREFLKHKPDHVITYEDLDKFSNQSLDDRLFFFGYFFNSEKKESNAEKLDPPGSEVTRESKRIFEKLKKLDFMSLWKLYCENYKNAENRGQKLDKIAIKKRLLKIRSRSNSNNLIYYTNTGLGAMLALIGGLKGNFSLVGAGTGLIIGSNLTHYKPASRVNLRISEYINRRACGKLDKNNQMIEYLFDKKFGSNSNILSSLVSSEIISERMADFDKEINSMMRGNQDDIDEIFNFSDSSSSNGQKNTQEDEDDVYEIFNMSRPDNKQKNDQDQK